MREWKFIMVYNHFMCFNACSNVCNSGFDYLTTVICCFASAMNLHAANIITPWRRIGLPKIFDRFQHFLHNIRRRLKVWINVHVQYISRWERAWFSQCLVLLWLYQQTSWIIWHVHPYSPGLLHRHRRNNRCICDLFYTCIPCQIGHSSPSRRKFNKKVDIYFWDRTSCTFP